MSPQQSTPNELSADRLHGFRRSSYQSDPAAGVSSLQEALEFVNRRGFVFFWPIDGVELPSLWVAAAGERPVLNEHDDPGHITWRWKDELLGSREWYYAKLLRRRATILSMELAPYFYALSENYGSPEEDYLIQYEQGRMKQETKNVYEIILERGPIDTVEIRRILGMTSKGSDYRFQRALTELQVDFKILPIAVTESGAWRYAFAYDLVPRHLPELPEQARLIQEREARIEILTRYFESVGASTLRQILQLFQWNRPDAIRALSSLTASGILLEGIRLPGSGESGYALRSLLQPNSSSSNLPSIDTPALQLDN